MEETILFLKETDISNMPLSELEEHICTFGLNNEVLQEQPRSLSSFYGKGLHLWQYPIQLAPYMKWVSELNVNSYLEIGCRWGGTFVVISELLKKNNPNIRLVACDPIGESSILKEYRKFSKFEYICHPSGSQEFADVVGTDIEMVFIDGDHSYQGCWRDWMLFTNNRNTKHIVFHDIDSSECRDVGMIWQRVKSDSFHANEFIRQYPREDIPLGRNFLGIGTLTRK